MRAGRAGRRRRVRQTERRAGLAGGSAAGEADEAGGSWGERRRAPRRRGAGDPGDSGDPGPPRPAALRPPPPALPTSLVPLWGDCPPLTSDQRPSRAPERPEGSWSAVTTSFRFPPEKLFAHGEPRLHPESSSFDLLPPRPPQSFLCSKGLYLLT